MTLSCMVVFFFQAEDGIRDLTVTGVQTCALPILARLPRLMGRGRALEVLLGADDIPGDLAELYGYVNRSLPDSDLDAFVESLATRIASFDKQAISETKRFADVASLPPDFEIAPEWDVCL